MNKNDYARIERALHFLAEGFRHWSSLEEIASRVHLSEFHFQHLFTRWVDTIGPRRANSRCWEGNRRLQIAKVCDSKQWFSNQWGRQQY